MQEVNEVAGTQRVDYQHLYVDANNCSGQPEPRMTICYVRDDNKTGVGIALCSFDDKPSKKCGRSIAHTRAQSALKGKTCAMGRTEAIYMLHYVSKYLLHTPMIRNGKQVLLKQDITGKAYVVEDPKYMVTYLHEASDA